MRRTRANSARGRAAIFQEDQDPSPEEHRPIAISLSTLDAALRASRGSRPGRNGSGVIPEHWAPSPASGPQLGAKVCAPVMTSRLFKIRMRPGRSLMGATSDRSEAPHASSGEEVVVDEHTAAHLVRNRAAEVVELVESSEDNPGKT
jgi:hypothetical protein